MIRKRLIMSAKKGNTNALKHGLYAKRFSDLDRTQLKGMSESDLRFEVAMLRVVIDRILTELEKSKAMDKRLPLYGSLMNAVTALNTTVRTHALLNGDDDHTLTAIEEALAAFRLENNL
jgi:hypothetical protein